MVLINVWKTLLTVTLFLIKLSGINPKANLIKKYVESEHKQ